MASSKKLDLEQVFNRVMAEERERREEAALHDPFPPASPMLLLCSPPMSPTAKFIMASRLREKLILKFDFYASFTIFFLI
jgi:hypothetical protein